MENPRALLCGGLPSSTRVPSPRSLPTDHDYAVSTREYQSDQPSRIAASTAFDAAVISFADYADLTGRSISDPTTRADRGETRAGLKDPPPRTSILKRAL